MLVVGWFFFGLWGSAKEIGRFGGRMRKVEWHTVASDGDDGAGTFVACDAVGAGELGDAGCFPFVEDQRLVCCA